MRVTVRKASGRDAAALAGLRWRGLVESGGSSEVDEGAFVESFGRWVGAHAETHLPFVVEVDGMVAGMAWLLVAERVPSPERPHRLCGDVQSVYVLPELRDRGVGTVLLDGVLAEAGRLGMEHVTVHSSDDAVPFYQRGGFRPGRTWLHWEPDAGR